MDSKLEELIEEIEQTSFPSRQIKPFNQPDLIAISSVDRTAEDPNANGFSSFSVNLPLPALDVKSLQLLQTNIPQANANIPNTACGFWYYRLSVYSGLTPSLDNLYYVRLLPTTYKQEYIYQPSQYGYNQTFNNYNAVATQLVKSCATDLLFNNMNQLVGIFEDFYKRYRVPFLPNDVSITYDTASNKFQMTGLNTKLAYITYDANAVYNVNDIITNTLRNKAYISIFKSLGVEPDPAPEVLPFSEWVSGTNYPLFKVLTYNGIVYQLVVDGENVNQSPAQQTPARYTRIGRALDVSQYASWVSGTNYNVGQVVDYNGSVYVLFNNGENVNNPPSAQPTHWVIQTTQITASTFWRRKYIDIVGSWYAGLLYPTGTIVEYNGVLYKSKSSSDSAFGSLPTNTTFWDLFNEEYCYRYLITGYDDPNVRRMQGDYFEVAWNNGRTYNVNDVVVYKNEVYRATKTNRGVAPAFSYISAWSNSTTYIINDVVSYNGVVYIARNTGTNQIPSSTSIFWIPQTPVSSNPVLSEWNVSTTYTQFQVVSYQGLMYVSTFSGSNTGSVPTANIRWALRNYVAWTNGSSYNIGKLVIYNENLYQSLINSNTTPTSNATNWTLLGSPINAWAYSSYSVLTGLYGLTSEFDMVEIRANGVYTINFPYGVGGQPYNPNPKRLLNSILGFTWNGSFTPSTLTNIEPYSILILTTTQQPLLYNRLRPVPDYRTSIAPPGLLGAEVGQDATATTSLTYTADSYANLVYSSIISIYADVVKASSVDTQGTTTLLALTSMNCGNLGIAFWSNYLENPLLKVQGDIYSISIQFRDEFGEPFMLSNNAVATLTFKLKY